MDMSFIFLVMMGFLTGVPLAGLFQTVTVAVTRRVGQDRSAQELNPRRRNGQRTNAPY